MKHKFLYYVLFFMYVNLFSQIDPPPDEDDTSVPIDTFVSVLVVTGAAYCIKKFKSNS